MTDPPVGDAEPTRLTTLLLVEDEFWIRRDVAESFRSAGFTVIEAVDGEDTSQCCVRCASISWSPIY